MRTMILASAILLGSGSLALGASCYVVPSGMMLDENHTSITRDMWRSYYSQMYKDVDRDQDGNISQDEWYEHYDRDFTGFDTDSNGTLSEDELQGQTTKGS